MSDYEIIKIPLDEIEKIDRAPIFGRMPILYLELVENKVKVQQDLIGKPYEPREIEEEEIEEEEIEEEDFEKDIGEQLEDILGDDKPSKVPTLGELQQKHPKKKIIQKEYKYAAAEDEEVVKERNDVYFHYEVLKRMHPNVNIPEFTMYSDPKIMAKKYELLAKKLSLDSSVENWKRYMIIFVMGCEIVLGKLNFDMEGFAQQQIMSMNTYDSLLVEMAEKSYTPSGSKTPVELRLFMMVIMNVGLFIVSKIIMKKTGTNLLEPINNLTNTHPEKLMKEPEKEMKI